LLARFVHDTILSKGIRINIHDIHTQIIPFSNIDHYNSIYKISTFHKSLHSHPITHQTIDTPQGQTDLVRRQALCVQKLLDSHVRSGRIIVKIDSVPRIRLDIRLKGAGGGEEFLGGSGDGGDGGVAGLHAIAAAEDEVFVCVGTGELDWGFEQGEVGEYVEKVRGRKEKRDGRGGTGELGHTSGDNLDGAGEHGGGWCAAVDGEEFAERVWLLVGFGIGEDFRVEVAWVEECILDRPILA
jgi:hypothetical protein